MCPATINTRNLWWIQKWPSWQSWFKSIMIQFLVNISVHQGLISVTVCLAKRIQRFKSMALLKVWIVNSLAFANMSLSIIIGCMKVALDFCGKIIQFTFIWEIWSSVQETERYALYPGELAAVYFWTAAKNNRVNKALFIILLTILYLLCSTEMFHLSLYLPLRSIL